MISFGSVPVGAVLPIMWTTYAGATGASVTTSGLAVTDIEVYKGTSMTQRASDNGYALLDTDGIDIDGVTGLHGISINTGDNSDAGFYTAGSFYTVVVSTITVDGQTVTFIAATFRLAPAENVAGLPAVDATAIGGATQTAANIGELANRLATMLEAAAGSPNEFRFTADALRRLQTVIGMAAGNLDTQLAALQADTDNIQTRLPAALVSGRMDVSVGAMAADVLTSSALATSAVTEIQTGLSTLTQADIRTAVGLASANLDTQLGTVTTQTTAASIRSAVGLASASLDTQISAIAGYVDTEVAAIKVATDRLLTTIEPAAGSPGDWQFTADALRAAPVTPALTATSIRSAVGLASANLDTQLSSISTKTANLPPDPADASDIAASFATVNSTLGTIAGYIDTEVGAIKTTTDRLATTLQPASGSPGDYEFTADALRRAPVTPVGLDAAGVRSAVGLAAANLDTQLGAISAKTTNLPSDPADASDIAAAFSTVNGNLAAVAADVDAVLVTTAKVDTLLQPAGGSPGDYVLTADALRFVPVTPAGLDAAGVRAAVGLATASLDSQLSAIRTPVLNLATTIEPAAGSPGEYRFTSDALEMAPVGSGAGGGGASASAIAAAVWGEALPGSFGGGTAGFILGTNLDAQVSTRASAAALATVSGFVDTEVAAIKVVTDRVDTLLQPAGGSPGDYELRADALRNAPTGITPAGVRAAVGLSAANLDAQLAGVASGGAIATAAAQLLTTLQPAAGSPGEFQFTADALELVPAPAAGTDWTATERQQIRHRLGIDGSASAPAATPSLATATAVAAVAAGVAAIDSVTDKLDTLVQPAGGSPGDYEFSADALRRTPVGAPGLDAAGVRAAVGLAAANLDTQLGGIAAKTVNLPADPADASDIAASFASVGSTLSTIAAAVDTEIPAILAVTAKLDTTLQAAAGSPGDWQFSADALELAPASTGGGGAAPSAATIAAAVWDEPLAGHSTSGSAGAALNETDEDAAAIRVVADALQTLLEPAPGSPGEFRLSADALRRAIEATPTAVDNADALLGRDIGSGTGAGVLNERTVRAALRFLRNRWNVVGSTLTVRMEDDTTVAWTSAVATQAGADPVTGIDPT